MSPEIKILTEIKNCLTGIDFQSLFGADWTVRHWRARNTRTEERPCVSIRYLETAPDDQRGPLHSTSEECWIMRLELVIDADLPTEASGLDPTGLETFALPAAHFFGAMRDPDSGILNMCDDVFDEGRGSDEDMSADEGRLVQAISVVYRTREGQPHILLAAGAN